MGDILTRKVNFIVISGDLFHVNLPDLESVKRVVEKLRQAKDQEIPVYMVYGSHDYSPNATAMIDVLDTAGLLTRVMEAEQDDDGNIRLSFIDDQSTGIKLCGLSGRSYALERKYYELLDRASLEKETGFRIFVLHTAVEKVKPASAAYGQGIAVTLLPQGFEYYAGGHIHEYVNENVQGTGRIVYPGALFGSTFTDLEITARGTKRGYIIVNCSDRITNLEFVENDLIETIYHEINGENRTSKEVNDELIQLCESIDPQGQIVLLKLVGILSSGKVSDIEFGKARSILKTKSADFVFINRRALTIRESTRIVVEGEAPEEIEKKVFTESLTDFQIPKTLGKGLLDWGEKNLKGDQGLQLSLQLLHIIKNKKQDGETNRDFETRIVVDGKAVLPRRNVD
jgi:DNA repair exonuclease SbcCD nuclease subunit